MLQLSSMHICIGKTEKQPNLNMNIVGTENAFHMNVGLKFQMKDTENMVGYT